MSNSNVQGGILADLKDQFKQLKQIRTQAEKPYGLKHINRNNKITQLQKPQLNQEQTLNETIKSGNLSSHILSRSSSFQQSSDHLSEFESLQKRYASTVRLLAESLEEQSNLRAVVELTSNPSEIYSILTQEDFSLASYGPLLAKHLADDLSADDELPILLRSTKIRSMLLEKEKLLEQMIDLRSRLDQEKSKRSEVEAQLKVAETLFHETQNDLENANQLILGLKNQLNGQKSENNKDSWSDIFTGSNSNNNNDVNDKKYTKNMSIAVPPLPDDDNDDNIVTKNMTKTNLTKPPRTPPATHLKNTNNNNISSQNDTNYGNNNRKYPIFSYQDFEDNENEDDHVIYNNEREGSEHDDYDSEHEEDLLQSLDGSFSKTIPQQNNYNSTNETTNYKNNRTTGDPELSDDDFPDDNEEDEQKSTNAEQEGDEEESLSEKNKQTRPQAINNMHSPAIPEFETDHFHDSEMSSESVNDDNRDDDKVILSIELDGPGNETAELEVFRHTMPATAALSFLQDHHLPPEYFAPLVRQIETLQKSLLVDSNKNDAEDNTKKSSYKNDIINKNNANNNNINGNDMNHINNLPTLDRKRRYQSPVQANSHDTVQDAVKNSHHNPLDVTQGNTLSMSLLNNDNNTKNSNKHIVKNNYNHNIMPAVAGNILLDEEEVGDEALYAENNKNANDYYYEDEYDAKYNEEEEEGEEEMNAVNSVDSFLQDLDSAPATLAETISVAKPIKTSTYLPVIPRMAGESFQTNGASYQTYETPIPHVNNINNTRSITNKNIENARTIMKHHVSAAPVSRADQVFHCHNYSKNNKYARANNVDAMEDLEDDVSYRSTTNHGMNDRHNRNDISNKQDISKQTIAGIVRKPVSTTAKLPQTDANNDTPSTSNPDINMTKQHSFSGLVRKKSNNDNHNMDHHRHHNGDESHHSNATGSRVVQSKIKSRATAASDTSHLPMPFTTQDRDNSRDANHSNKEKDLPKSSSFFSFSPLSSPVNNNNNKSNIKSSVSHHNNINNNFARTRKTKEESISETPVQVASQSSGFLASFMRSKPSPPSDTTKTALEKQSKMPDFLHHNTNRMNNHNNHSNNSVQKPSLSNNKHSKTDPKNIGLL